MLVRLATDEEGHRIAELTLASGFTVEGLDWSEVHPYWLVAEEDGNIIGCIQIILGKPIGWLEMLSLEPQMGRKRKGRTVKALVSHGVAYLKGFGATVAMGTVPDDLDSYIKVLLHRGAVVTGHGFTVAKRV